MRQRQLFIVCAGVLLLATTVSGDGNSTQGHTGDSASANDPRLGHADSTLFAPFACCSKVENIAIQRSIACDHFVSAPHRDQPPQDARP